MKEKTLFFSKDKEINRSDIHEALEYVEADNCKVLYVHSGITFGTPNPELPRTELIKEIYDIFLSLGIETICMPTFTFSFCNGKDFDLANSKSSMGVLNEFFRLQQGVTRSLDPLMSVALMGKDKDLVENLGMQSIGKQSTFDKLSKRDKVKFLFFGAYLADCFTYMHYLEWLAKVPYRYDRNFKGNIIKEGKKQIYESTLFVRYNNIKPNMITTTQYAKKLENMGLLKVKSLGNGLVSSLKEEDAHSLYMDLLNKDPDYFICEKFDESQADKSFYADNMVAL